MAVMWTTNSTQDYEPLVWWGTSAEELSFFSKGVSHTYTDGGWMGLIHTALMDTLLPGQMYYYQVGSAAVQSQVFSFKSAPDPSARPPVRIAAYGDSGSQMGAANTTRLLASLLNHQTPDEALDFVLQVGDIAYDKGDQFLWDDLYNLYQRFAAYTPFMTCPGNEDHAFEFVGYRSRLFMPTQKLSESLAPWYYSFDYSYVHVVSLSTEFVSLYNDSEQYAWLEADLKAATSAPDRRPWIIAIAHRPLYCSSSDYYDCGMWGPKMRESLEPLLKKYGVDFLLGGHVHNYERSYPAYAGEVTQESYTNAPSTTHIVVGAGGAGLTTHWAKSRPAWSANRDLAYGVGQFIVHNATHLDFEYVLADGSNDVFDVIHVIKQ